MVFGDFSLVFKWFFLMISDDFKYLSWFYMILDAFEMILYFFILVYMISHDFTSP